MGEVGQRRLHFEVVSLMCCILKVMSRNRAIMAVEDMESSDRSFMLLCLCYVQKQTDAYTVR